MNTGGSSLTQDIGSGRLPTFRFGLDLGFSVYWFLLFMDFGQDQLSAFNGYSDQQYKDCLSFFFCITFSTIELPYSMFEQFCPLS